MYVLLYSNFCMNSYSVDIDEAMKRVMLHCFTHAIEKRAIPPVVVLHIPITTRDYELRCS
jgi:hypothetical protein